MDIMLIDKIGTGIIVVINLILFILIIGIIISSARDKYRNRK
jgi:hypothetical protein